MSLIQMFCDVMEGVELVWESELKLLVLKEKENLL